MGRNIKIIVILAIFIGMAGRSYAAPEPNKPSQPAVGEKQWRRHRSPAPISRNQAVLMALIAHSRSKLVEVELCCGVYSVIVATKSGDYIVRIEAATGIIIANHRYQPMPPGAPGSRARLTRVDQCPAGLKHSLKRARIIGGLKNPTRGRRLGKRTDQRRTNDG
jgi:hypothetical protein